MNTLAKCLLISGTICMCLGIIGKLHSVFGADADPPCLTKQQARAKFKTSHLYWHTEDHCWDNKHGGSKYHRPHREHRDPVFGKTAMAQDANGGKSDRIVVKTVDRNEYNELDAQADQGAFFRTTPMPLWPPVLIPLSRFKLWDERIQLEDKR